MFKKGSIDLVGLFGVLLILSSCSVSHIVSYDDNQNNNGNDNVNDASLSLGSSVASLDFQRSFVFESDTPLLTDARMDHTATMLTNGKVLIIGGDGATGLAELYDPDTNTFSSFEGVARTGHTSTLLANGKVLIAGGYDASWSVTASAVLYDPDTNTFTATTGTLATARRAHSAILLPNGKVLIAGGVDSGGLLSSAELYDPDTQTFNATGNINTPRRLHTAVLLSNGKVLFTGGYDSDSVPTTSAELYDPDTGVFTATGSLARGRYFHTATLLSDGKVLIAAGYNDVEGEQSSAELYDPEVQTFSTAGSLNDARYSHSATLLPNGEVLITGGSRTNDDDHVSSTEIYDPVTNLFRTNVESLGTLRMLHTATLLSNGKVLIVGGYNTDVGPTNVAELFGVTVPSGVYEVQFTATGGTAPYTYSIISGGGSINALTGLYNAQWAKGDTVVIGVTDAVGANSTASVSLSISE